MQSHDEWTRLSARIRSLIKASEVTAAHFAQLSRNDSHGAFIDLGNEARSICVRLQSFSDALDTSDLEIKGIIEAATRDIYNLLPDQNNHSIDTRQIYIRAALIKLAAAESRVEYLLSDRQSEIRTRTERSFEHLQRMIAIDEQYRGKWSLAFDTGEVACEKLGAVHLLGHGIWAFKVSAAGGRTDLVYQLPLTDLERVDRASEGLVLTEWKKLVSPTKVVELLAAARRQSEKYSKGVLGGTELARMRYLVLVSKNDVELPEDAISAGVVHRHLNIAVEPRTPSKL